jgi:hypothetical protein
MEETVKIKIWITSNENSVTCSTTEWEYDTTLTQETWNALNKDEQEAIAEKEMRQRLDWGVRQNLDWGWE